jgi:cytochrome c-type biogenesis protein CcmH/NrfG
MSAEVRLMLLQAAASREADQMLRAGDAALELGLAAAALNPVERVLGEHRDDARLWQLLGRIRLRLQETPSAIDAFAKAAELAPGDAAIASEYAFASYEAGLPAVHLFEKARHLAPSDRGILLRLAAAQRAEGQVEAAIRNLERETKKAPGWIEGHTALARIRWARGEEESFAVSFERALAATPREVGLWHGYISQLFHAGLQERALAAINRGRAAAGQHRLFDAAEVYVRCERGEAQAAVSLFQRLQPLREPELVINYVRLLIRAGQVKDAAAIAEQEAPRDPLGRFWPYLATCWRLLGDKRWELLEGDPRFIGVYDIKDSLPPLEAVAERLRLLHDTVAPPLGQSLRGGTQTDGNLFSRIEPEIQGVRAAVAEAVKRHIAQLPTPPHLNPHLIPEQSPVSFAGSWSVRLTGGGRHLDHVHTSGWLSSALYITVPSQQQRGDGQAGWLTFGEVGDLGISLPPIRTVEPKPGRLVLFPSTMWHGTRAFGEGERLTIAFDVRRP